MNQVVPILVRTPGRSGSTLIMQILASSNKIAFPREYPFEVRHLCYLTRAAQVLSRPFDPQAAQDLPFEWNPGFFFNQNPTFLGPIPSRHDSFDEEAYFGFLHNGLLKGFENQLLADNEEVRFYAEKVTANDIIAKLERSTRCKVIYGVRDPRDQMVSIMNFNKRRGNLGFGWQAKDTELSFAEKFAKRLKPYLRKIISLLEQPNPDAYVLRYEKLITSQEEEVSKLSSWLGVSLDTSFVESNKADVLQKHSTSTDPEASVAKWKKDLSQEAVLIFEKHLSDELAYLQLS